MIPDPLSDGVLVVDKPEGITSHDVVAVARRHLGQRQIGHTGTLDPLATGVLPLACGRATRLVRFLSGCDKDYVAVVRFGLTTDSYDVTGQETGRSDQVPDAAAVAAALPSLRGDYLQMPPAFSAKKVGGRRAYEGARRGDRVELTAVPVRVTRADLIELHGATGSFAITCSSGFYVRSFADTLGQMVGTGACLQALRRTRSGQFTLDQAIALAALQESAAGRPPQIVPLEQLLGHLPAVHTTLEGERRVAHGMMIGAEHCGEGRGPRAADAAGDGWTRVFGPGGHLIAVGRVGDARDPAALHPSVVLI